MKTTIVLSVCILIAGMFGIVAPASNVEAAETLVYQAKVDAANPVFEIEVQIPENTTYTSLVVEKLNYESGNGWPTSSWQIPQLSRNTFHCRATGGNCGGVTRGINTGAIGNVLTIQGNYVYGAGDEVQIVIDLYFDNELKRGASCSIAYRQRGYQVDFEITWAGSCTYCWKQLHYGDLQVETLTGPEGEAYFSHTYARGTYTAQVSITGPQGGIMCEANLVIPNDVEVGMTEPPYQPEPDYCEVMGTTEMFGEASEMRVWGNAIVTRSQSGNLEIFGLPDGMLSIDAEIPIVDQFDNLVLTAVVANPGVCYFI
ncbi:hypothetical protein A2382_03955 [Candidatus Woesebacteria bacterium RIFOXYB1_FULL_38_16]|uniref:PKD domain-containing protein n=1 Tax=Candidatus Woesebacteria bacterium RIFOXYB1_FULL_38_16 TaxID=1802538 RepID=A0A1F8CSE4_9BACT|nr:MAG: hypothetical protein A2382_03955 [Candidatus Woesebacteria bacterium RIFOXYB1_FULL_38_16]